MFVRVEALRRLARRWRSPARSTEPTGRAQRHHIVILDGTLSSLKPGRETNAGLTYKLLREVARENRISLYYEPGLQWRDLKSGIDVLIGRGINRQIRRAYGFLASRYRAGDRISLLGYSRGAFAVRSLAGVIDRVGLLRHPCATERNIRLAYRHYKGETSPDSRAAFRKAHSWGAVGIEMVGVWDTVKALGARVPFNYARSEAVHAFHDHSLSHIVQHGFHALALDETRAAFAPLLWETDPSWPGETLEQVWFRGHHGDLGGQQSGYLPARPLANIPLVWMLENIERCGTVFPDGWKTRFPQDVTAPSAGLWRGPGGLALRRKSRVVGRDPSERLHTSVALEDLKPRVRDVFSRIS